MIDLPGVYIKFLLLLLFITNSCFSQKPDGQALVSLSLRKTVVQSWANTWFDVWTRSCEKNLFESLPTIHCPVYFFAGEKDFNTNYSITGEYFNKVSAHKKDFFLFSNAGHGLPETNSERFQQIVIVKILSATKDK